MSKWKVVLKGEWLVYKGGVYGVCGESCLLQVLFKILGNILPKYKHLYASLTILILQAITDKGQECKCLLALINGICPHFQGQKGGKYQSRPKQIIAIVSVECPAAFLAIFPFHQKAKLKGPSPYSTNTVVMRK